MPPKRKNARANPKANKESTPMNSADIARLVAQQVADALAVFETNRNSRAVNEGAGAAANEGTGSLDGAGAATRGVENTVRGCSYKEFMSCKPLSFNGTEGTVGLICWFEKLESVFRISNCANHNRVKYATYTLLNSTLTWWNAYA